MAARTPSPGPKRASRAKAKPGRKQPRQTKRRVTPAGSKAGRSTASAVLEAASAGATTAVTGARDAGAATLGLARRLFGVPEVRRALGCAALGLVVTAASWGVRQRVETWPDYRIDADGLRCSAPPAGLSRRTLDDLERLPLPEDASAFSPEVVPLVAAWLRATEWVDGVDSVRMEPTGKLAFRVRARTPVARLDGDAGHAITADGGLLSAGYVGRLERLPTVTGVASPARPLARRRGLEAAVATLTDLGPLSELVEAVDLSNLGGRRDPRSSEVVLRLRSGLVVDWGRPSTSDRPQRTTEERLAALSGFLEGTGDLAAVERVSVRWDQTTVVLRPAVAAGRAGNAGSDG